MSLNLGGSGKFSGGRYLDSSELVPLLGNGSGLLDRGSGLLDWGSGLLDRGSGLLDRGSGLLDRGSGLLGNSAGRSCSVTDEMCESYLRGMFSEGFVFGRDTRFFRCFRLFPLFFFLNLTGDDCGEEEGDVFDEIDGAYPRP